MTGAGRPHGITTRVMEAVAGAPDGITAPEIVTLLGLEPGGRSTSRVRSILMGGVTEGWAVRSGTRRGVRNKPMVIYRAPSRGVDW